MMYFVYLIRSRQDSSVYVGYTEDLDNRIKEHNSGKVRSTKGRIPYDLIYSEQFESKREARIREIRIKKNYALKKAILDNLNSGPVV